MKYIYNKLNFVNIIITENQKKSLEDKMIDYFNRNIHFSPFNMDDVILNLKLEGEFFFELENDELISYTMCDNFYSKERLDDKYCPLVAIPKKNFDNLNVFFGDMWKPLFRDWFKEKTGLIANHITTV